MIKKLTTTLALGALLALASFQAPAQQYSITTLQALTNITADTTVTLNLTVPMTRFDQGAFLVGSIQNTNATNAVGSSGNIVLSFGKSIDGTNWLAGAQTYTIAQNALTQVYYVTNFSADSIGYWRLTSVQNTAASNTASVFIRYATKPRRSG